LPRDEAEDRARALVTFRDTTAEYANRQELAAFASVVAHDLGNPLAAVDGWNRIIAEQLDGGGFDPETTRMAVDRSLASVEQMRGLIADLLARATSTARELHATRVDIPSLVAEIAAARDAEQQVSCAVVPPVCGDAVLIRQVLDNVVGNALKYVPPGRVPQVRVTGARIPDDLVRLSVADNGVGLPPGEHERIFEEFHRAHPDDFEGSGLGLSICRRIVERHGGTITARDNPEGQGTVIELTLPAVT